MGLSTQMAYYLILSTALGTFNKQIKNIRPEDITLNGGFLKKAVEKEKFDHGNQLIKP
jgi:hypothetical protein